MGYKIKISSDAKDFIVDKGYDDKFGARHLQRAIQKYLEDPLAEEIIKSKLSEGDTINVGLNKAKNEIKINITKSKAKIAKDARLPARSTGGPDGQESASPKESSRTNGKGKKEEN